MRELLLDFDRMARRNQAVTPMPGAGNPLSGFAGKRGGAMNMNSSSPYKFPVCLQPDEIIHFIDSFIQILDSLPTGKAKTSLERLYAEFKERMEADGINKYSGVIPNEMPIKMDALQEIYEISNSLSYIMMALEAAHEDEYMAVLLIYLPSVKRLERVVREKFPDFIGDVA
jgi:hypothetical protein